MVVAQKESCERALFRVVAFHGFRKLRRYSINLAHTGHGIVSVLSCQCMRETLQPSLSLPGEQRLVGFSLPVLQLCTDPQRFDRFRLLSILPILLLKSILLLQRGVAVYSLAAVETLGDVFSAVAGVVTVADPLLVLGRHFYF